MENSQLIKKENSGGYSKVYPLAYIQGIIDSESGEKLSDILIRFNHLLYLTFLTFNLLFHLLLSCFL